MVYLDHFGAYIPFSEEERFYKNRLMAPSSEGLYKMNKERAEIFKDIREIQEENRARLFPQPTLSQTIAESKLFKPIIITNLLKKP